jgi:hypothetical protein
VDASLTLDALFTAAGAVAAAAVVRQLIELLKAAVPALGAKVSGAAQAFAFSAVLYVLAFLAVGPFTPDGIFMAILAWIGCATAAIGINSSLGHFTGSTNRAIEDRVSSAYSAGHADGVTSAGLRVGNVIGASDNVMSATSTGAG